MRLTKVHVRDPYVRTSPMRIEDVISSTLGAIDSITLSGDLPDTGETARPFSYTVSEKVDFFMKEAKLKEVDLYGRRRRSFRSHRWTCEDSFFLRGIHNFFFEDFV
jgi:hypothetical protein